MKQPTSNDSSNYITSEHAKLKEDYDFAVKMWKQEESLNISEIKELKEKLQISVDAFENIRHTSCTIAGLCPACAAKMALEKIGKVE